MSKFIRRLFLVSLLIIFLVIGTAAGWLYAGYVAPGPLATATTVIIPKGTGINKIAILLKDKGVLDKPIFFVVGVRLEGDGVTVKAGEYTIPAKVSPRGVIEILKKGETVQRRITVAEGLTTAEILDQLFHAEGLVGDMPLNVDEGVLLPETYHFSYGDTLDDMIRRMKEAMAKELAVVWRNRPADSPLKTIEEVVILASIVEKETGLAAERPHIAAVFLNRLKKGMRLQSDPTVIYALTEGQGKLDRPLTRQDWKFNSPYNTYQIKGLPPGPICNPGKDSLHAVLNPIKSDDLYFVADGTGGHVFAKTLKQHNRNVAKWRKIKQGMKN